MEGLFQTFFLPIILENGRNLDKPLEYGYKFKNRTWSMTPYDVFLYVFSRVFSCLFKVKLGWEGVSGAKNRKNTFKTIGEKPRDVAKSTRSNKTNLHSIILVGLLISTKTSATVCPQW